MSDRDSWTWPQRAARIGAPRENPAMMWRACSARVLTSRRLTVLGLGVSFTEAPPPLYLSVAGERVDDADDYLVDFWCGAGGRQEEAEQQAENQLPHAQPHESPGNKSGHGHQQHERNRYGQSSSPPLSVSKIWHFAV